MNRWARRASKVVNEKDTYSGALHFLLHACEAKNKLKVNITNRRYIRYPGYLGTPTMRRCFMPKVLASHAISRVLLTDKTKTGNYKADICM